MQAQCKLCSGALEAWLDMPIDAMKDEPTPFNRVLRCAECGVGTTQPTPSIEQIPSFYQLQNYYTQGESHIETAKAGILDRLLTKAAWSRDHSQLLDPDEFAAFLPAGGTICDLGCGDGWNLERFKRRGFRVIGVDPDPKSRDQGAAKGVEILPGTSESLPDGLAGRQFDFVVMTHSLEHTLNPQLALSNAASLTKPGGYFYCEVPNCESIHFEMLTVCSTNLDVPRHLWHFSPRGFRRVIEAAGFRFESWRFAGFSRHHLPSWRKWEMTVYDRLAKRGPVKQGRSHTFATSVAMFLRSAFAAPEKKYDCVGVLSKRGS